MVVNIQNRGYIKDLFRFLINSSRTVISRVVYFYLLSSPSFFFLTFQYKVSFERRVFFLQRTETGPQTRLALEDF